MSTPLPDDFSEEDYAFALNCAKLASQTYDDDDNDVVNALLKAVKGIDNVKEQSFTTPDYEVIESTKNNSLLKSIRDDGLDYSLFKHKDTGHLVLAFRGTEPLSIADWLSDAKQVLGKSRQYKTAVGLAKRKVKDLGENGDVEISFTGHSLGGGLATACALATGKKAVVFDAAGLSGATTDELDLPDLMIEANKANITNINVRECFVSDWNKKMDDTTLGTLPLFPCNQYGRQIWLESVSKEAKFKGLLSLLPGVVESFLETFLNHAWHVYTYQLENRKFLPHESTPTSSNENDSTMAPSETVAKRNRSHVDATPPNAVTPSNKKQKTD
uniref:Fungal lipase-like domain-containing protein n=1 Tax=Grammatophora oceanica TaxID=210454 RepID=A0A7S1V4L5_9STRA|mmetsp:Transcript_36507/g.54448  ORF Transcript_36507/g.54448 Transcript_36507/m.54448 type:complete len:329 (+) Transcript_36507:93-1079(+)